MNHITQSTQIKCDNGKCPMRFLCRTFSIEQGYDYVTYQFDIGKESDEQQFHCNNFIPNDITE